MFLKIIGEPFLDKKKKKALFQCTLCGNEKIINYHSVISGATKSCGCYNRMSASLRMSKMNNKSSHGLMKHPLYQSWKSMKIRCKNVKKEWSESFKNFYDWAIQTWQPGLVLRRKDYSIEFNEINCYFGNRPNNANPEKAKNTCLLKYGVEHPQQTKEVRNKVEQTNLHKYGVKFPSLNSDIRDKQKQTFIRKYGVDNPLKSDKIREKIKNTMNEKYGVDYPSQSVEIRNKQKLSLLNKYGTLVVNSNNDEQNKIRDWLVSITDNSWHSSWSILNGKEIDLVNDNLKLGIEYCGLYWHTEFNERHRKYHWEKYDLCKKKGYKLLTIFSDEWQYRNIQVKNFVRSILGINKNKIFARKCSIKQLNVEEYKNFVNNNHIQGYSRRSLVAYGLFYDKQLVGAMSLAKHHRFTDNNIIVLDRLCFLDNYTIIGGASKLFKYCNEWAKFNNYKSVISWSDNRWSDGNVYINMGFILEKELAPDYSYVLLSNPKIRIPKQKMKKKNINCPKNKTESEFTKELGYSRIWDCGKKRWVFNF
jgi:hypothetical protein